jgi:hypothetical protein
MTTSRPMLGSRAMRRLTREARAKETKRSISNVNITSYFVLFSKGAYTQT